jgi:hypothetical protein
VEVENLRELTSGGSGTTPEDAHHQALGPSDAEFRLHLLGGGLQAVTDAPDRAHELQDLAQNGLVFTDLAVVAPPRPVLS